MESADGGMRTTLASELARLQAMVRDLEANMDHQDLPPSAREICDELACRVDRSLHIARSWSAAADGSPRGDGGQDTAGTGKVDGARYKRRKGVAAVRKQVRVTSVQDMAVQHDGFSWRKYGQKDILGAMYPRAYFRCTHRHTHSCPATKQLQRTDSDPLVFDVVYIGAHTCGVQAARPASTERQPGHAGMGQSAPRPLESGGIHQAGFEHVTTAPFPFASALAPGTDVCPHLSPTSLDWQLRSSHGAGVEFEQQQQWEEFFSNPSDSYQWDVQDLF